MTSDAVLVVVGVLVARPTVPMTSLWNVLLVIPSDMSNRRKLPLGMLGVSQIGFNNLRFEFVPHALTVRPLSCAS